MRFRLEYREQSGLAQGGYWLSMIDEPMTYDFPVTLDLFDGMPGGVHELEVSLPANVMVSLELINPLRDPFFDPRTPRSLT